MPSITNRNRRSALGWLGAAALAAAAPALRAQSAYPWRPVRLIVPYPPGGNTDSIARDVMKELAAALGQPIVVDNKPGANSILGTDLAAKAAPDGHTLLLVIGAYANNQTLYRKLPYAPSDFVPVSLLTRTSLVLASALPQVRQLDDLVRESAKPGGVTFASSGVGSAAHLLGERFARAAGLKQATHVPYKGSTDALSDLVAGRVSFMFDAVAALGPHIQGGKLAALAVTGAERSPLLPAVPTLRELGHPELTSSAWAALLAPARTPEPVVQKLAAQLAAVLKNPQLKAKLAAISTETVGSTPAEAAAFIAGEVKVNGEIIRQLALSLDNP